MAKQLKINIKNTQIAQGLQIGKREEPVEESREVVEKESKVKRERAASPKVSQTRARADETAAPEELKVQAKDSAKKEEAPRVKARTKSAFSGPVAETQKSKESPKEVKETEKRPLESPINKGNAALRRELFGAEAEEEIVRSQKASKRPNPLLANLEEMPVVEEKSSAAPQERAAQPEIPQKGSVSQAPSKPVESAAPPMAQSPKPEAIRSASPSSIPPPPPRTQASGEQSSVQTPLSRAFDQPRNRESHGGRSPSNQPPREQTSRDHAPRDREQGRREYTPREHQGPRDSSRSPSNQPHREYGQREASRGPGSYPREQRPASREYGSREPGSHGPRGPGSYPPRDHARGPRDSSQGPREYTPREPGSRPPYGADRRESYGPRREEFQQGPRAASGEPRVKLGPTGKHINDYLPTRYQHKSRGDKEPLPVQAAPAKALEGKGVSDRHKGPKTKAKTGFGTPLEEELNKGAPSKTGKNTFTDTKPVRKKETSFDARDRYGLRATDDEGTATHWKKRRHAKAVVQEDTTIRPTQLKIRLPIVLKDLAAEMKLKASQLVAKLFLQGVTVTLNDILEDEIVVQLLGQEFGCAIQIDTSAEERIRITDKTIKEEIAQFDEDQKTLRAPIVAFMGHVDHGKTSLIDAIRKSNRAAGEAGAITQHIGAFRCQTKVGEITILDTPGHEAFSAMRARGADVTDIVVLVVAGDEGIRAQTVEAIQHAKAAGVTIVVALNKSDKPNFNPDNVYRQLADQELLPEAWGGSTITVNCSAVSGEGIETLLEMLAIQAEILELKSVPTTRARGRVLESEMHKGMGAVATVLVQNGTLHKGDCVVFDQHWGRIKTMKDEHGIELSDAGPSTPVSITGLSGLPEAGHEFIVVKNEREAREISEARTAGARLLQMQQKKKVTIESLMQQSAGAPKKVLNIIMRADVQGSLEALKVALQKIESSKVELNIILSGVGEISESDVQLATTSKAVIIGFHTRVESHTEPAIKQLGVQVKLHDIIYHAIDDVKMLMSGLLDKIAKEEPRGSAIVKAIFKSSQHGVIAGCQVTEGSIHRNHFVRVIRKGEQVWKGTIQSLKRVKEDVREVQKGLECGILLSNYNELVEGDIIDAYEIIYLTQEL